MFIEIILEHLIGSPFGDAVMSIAPLVGALIGGGLGAIGSIGGALIGKGGGDDELEAANENIRKAIELYENYPIPEYTPLAFTPEEYQYLGDFDPEAYAMPTMEQFDLIGEDPALRQGVLASLAKLEDLREGELDAATTADLVRAEQMAGAAAANARESAMREARARGVGSGSLEFALMQSGNQAANQSAQQAAVDRAALNAQMRALANMELGDRYGQLRSADFNVNQANTDISNQALQRFSQRAFDIANKNTQNRNTAALDNLSRQQDVQSANIDQRNKARYDELLDQRAREEARYNANISKLQGMSNAYTGHAQNLYNQAAGAESEKQNLWGNVGRTVGAAGATVADAMRYEDMAKRDDARYDKFIDAFSKNPKKKEP